MFKSSNQKCTRQCPDRTVQSDQVRSPRHTGGSTRIESCQPDLDIAHWIDKVLDQSNTRRCPYMFRALHPIEVLDHSRRDMNRSSTVVDFEDTEETRSDTFLNRNN